MKEFNKLWKEFDENEIDRHTCSKMTILNKLLPLAGEKKENIESESNTVYLIFALHQILSYVKEIKIEEINRYVQQFFQTRNAKEIPYLTLRLQETKSHQNKWRYALICFLLTKKPHYASEMINNLLECSRIHLKQNDSLSCIQLLVIAFNMNKLYRLKFDDKISKSSLQTCFELENTEQERYLIEPTEVFCLLNNKAEKDIINRLFTIVHRAAKRFVDEKNYHLQRSLLEASLGLCNLTSLSQDEKLKLRKQIQLMIAKSHEVEADDAFKENNGLAAVTWYEDAQKIVPKSWNVFEG